MEGGCAVGMLCTLRRIMDHVPKARRQILWAQLDLLVAVQPQTSPVECIDHAENKVDHGLLDEKVLAQTTGPQKKDGRTVCTLESTVAALNRRGVEQSSGFDRYKRMRCVDCQAQNKR